MCVPVLATSFSWMVPAIAGGLSRTLAVVCVEPIEFLKTQAQARLWRRLIDTQDARRPRGSHSSRGPRGDDPRSHLPVEGGLHQPAARHLLLRAALADVATSVVCRVVWSRHVPSSRRPISRVLRRAFCAEPLPARWLRSW